MKINININPIYIMALSGILSALAFLAYLEGMSNHIVLILSWVGFGLVVLSAFTWGKSNIKEGISYPIAAFSLVVGIIFSIIIGLIVITGPTLKLRVNPGIIFLMWSCVLYFVIALDAVILANVPKKSELSDQDSSYIMD